MLQTLYQRLVVPEAVRDELHAGRVRGEDVMELAEYNWIEVRSIPVPEEIALLTDLGSGEAQVLALATEAPGSLVILDDGLARAVAKARNIRCTGTAGVLLRAKQEGHIAAVAPLLDRLMQLGFWLRESTRDAIVALAQE